MRGFRLEKPESPTVKDNYDRFKGMCKGRYLVEDWACATLAEAYDKMLNVNYCWECW